MPVLPVKRGLSSPAVTSIPQDWDRQWFRYFIDNFLTNADIRNVTPGTGIVISGNVSGNSTSGTASSSVTISQAPVANNTVMGNVSGITAVPVALSQTQLTTLINIFTSTLSGAVPASGGGTANFLRADGTWNIPAGSAAIPNNTVLGNVSGVTATPVALTQTQLTALINVFTSTLSGAVPASGGGTTTFLRADASFATPPTFTSIAAGYVPASGGGTTNFLRADGTFAVPAQPSGANPSGLIGLTAVNGVAATFDRSDSTHALDQGIVPTWTGVHTFSARPAFNLGATVAGGTFISRGISDSATSTALTIASTGAVTIAAPSSGNALSVTGVNSAIATIITSGLPGSTAGADLKVVRAGSTINQAAQGPNLFLNDSTNTTGYYLQDSGGQFEIWSSTGAGPTLTQILKILTTGAMTINAPSSGTTLQVNSPGSVVAARFSSAALYTGISIQDGATGTREWWLLSGGFGTGIFSIYDNTAGAHRFRIDTGGAVTIPAPTTGDALTVTNVAGSNAVVIAGNSAGTAVVRFNTQGTTGANTLTPTWTNFPGTAGTKNPATWLPVNVDGTTRYIACFS